MTAPTQYRVQFSTSIVKPDMLPHFPYVASKVNFDSILFTAIVPATDPINAVEQVTGCWSHAEVRYIQPEADEFERSDTLMSCNWYGTMVPRKERHDAYLIIGLRYLMPWAFKQA